MKFLRQTSLAIDPKAYGTDWAFDGPGQAAPDVREGVATITIRGPLSHHPEWWFDSYDSIVSRVHAACACPEVKVILFEGDTPGGDVSGCFASAQIIRRAIETAGKKAVWYVDGQTCSAGLALAMACDYVAVPLEGRFGSIGVIAELQSVADRVAASGVDVRLVTSGARKADGHPMAPISDDTIAEVQAAVDSEAGVFFDWVALRTSIPRAEIESWQARVFHGAEARAVGLADFVTDDEGAFAFAAALAAGEDQPMPGKLNKPKATAGATTSAKKASLEEARKILGELASDDSDEGRAARKMLDVSDAEEPTEDRPKPHEEPDGDEGEDESDGSGDEDEDDGDDAADSAEDDSAEDEAEDDSAEDESDAKKAEDESKQAKACLAAALTSDRAMRAALARGDSKAAKAALKAADRSRAEAARHTRDAGIYRSNARVHASVAKAVKSTKSGARAAVETLRGHLTPGSKPPTPPTAPSASALPTDFARAAGLITPATATAADILSADGLGAIPQAQAQAAYEELQGRIRAMTGGAK